MTKRIGKYGMKVSTIRYYQQQARELMRYNGIAAGRFAVSGKGQAQLDARAIGHGAIQMAAVLTSAGVRSHLGAALMEVK